MPDSECDSKCSGDQTQICGGNWAINVYSVLKEENTNNQSCAHIIEGIDQKYCKSNKYTKQICMLRIKYATYNELVTITFKIQR